MKHYSVSFFVKYVIKSLPSLRFNYYVRDDWQISSLANAIRVLANMKDPIGHVLNRTEVSKGLKIVKSDFFSDKAKYEQNTDQKPN